MSQTSKVKLEPKESSVRCSTDDIVTQSALSESYSAGGRESESKIKCEVEEFPDNKSTACSETSALHSADSSHQLIDSAELKEDVKKEFSQEPSSNLSDYSSTDISESDISSDISSTEGYMKEESNCALIFQQHEEEAVKEEEDVNRWSKSDTLALIDLVGQHQTNFDDSKLTKKQIYERISKAMKSLGHSFSGDQCSRKFNSLKLAYKKAKDQNNRSGTGRMESPFFTELDNLLSSKPEVYPLSTCSSSETTPNPLSDLKRKAEMEFTPTKPKKKQAEAQEAQERREWRQALLQRHDRFLDLLEKLVNR